MRIAHCIHGLSLGGAQKVLETIVSSLSSPEFEHFVYCSFDGPVRAGIESSGASVDIIPRRWPKFDPAWVRSLSRAMRTDQIDLVHTHLFGDSLHGFLAARSAGQLPVVMTLHRNQARFNRLQKLGYRWLLPKCQGVVACSHSVGSSFVAAQPGLEEKLIVIPNGIAFDKPVDLERREQESLRDDLGLDPDSLLLAAMGRFVEEKGYNFLIQAFSRLPADVRAQSQLLLLGQGPLEDSLNRLAQKLGVADRVIFGGYRQDVPRILSIVDVVVFSSLWEGLSIALLEAMASEKCIVATDIQSFRDAVESDSEVILAPPADPVELSAALQRVIGDAGLRKMLGQRAGRRFRECFTASTMARSYERLYRKVHSTRSAPSP